ncbi:hypothetical protein ATO13_22156 [Stappia sp. 22II-S9-Z10]|nr:hypothetical protein ATO13_22156 [Stappia sp. 22II-S9-Z10]
MTLTHPICICIEYGMDLERRMTGEDVKALRTRLGWSQKQLAEYLGVRQPTVFRIENGQNPSGPVAKLLEQLSDGAPAAPTEPEGAAA